MRALFLSSAGSDYTPLDTTYITLDGNIFTTVTIPILDDDLSEPTEMFELRFVEMEVTNAYLLKPVGVISIVDDEAGEQLK